ncbi:MAG: hypothetical protein IMF17_07500 [Proteobacteria bacterium]|nr:hypothetical protein [Pseudomonadota bacterium]
MSNLVEKLKIIAVQGNKSYTPVIEAAIDRIQELEAKLSDYEEDITDWQNVVEQQMKHRTDNK